jgi:hypothetical protein
MCAASNCSSSGCRGSGPRPRRRLRGRRGLSRRGGGGWEFGEVSYLHDALGARTILTQGIPGLCSLLLQKYKCSVVASEASDVSDPMALFSLYNICIVLHSQRLAGSEEPLQLRSESDY